MQIEITAITEADRQVIGDHVRELWGDELILAHREAFHTTSLPGLKAVHNGKILGFLHYQLGKADCEILTLASLIKRQGIGTALVEALEAMSRLSGCKRLMVTTTNDNLGAMAFYQHCGFSLSGVGLGLVDEARKQKPTLPEIGDHQIPIHDEIYLEKILAGQS